MGIEREMKFDLEAALEPDLEGLGAAVGARRSVELVADYWDTRSGHLRAWGITVRHRRSDDGTEDGWTVKIPVPHARASSPPGRRNGTERTRVEIDVAGGPDVPPSRVLAIVSGLACSEPFERVAHLVTDRCSTLLVEESSGGGTARYVDSSLERLQVKISGMASDRYVLTCNGVSVPLQWDQKNRQDRELAARLAGIDEARARREELQRAHEAEVRFRLGAHGDLKVSPAEGSRLIGLAQQEDVAEAANKLRTGPKGNSYAECETIGRWYLGLTDTGATK